MELETAQENTEVCWLCNGTGILEANAYECPCCGWGEQTCYECEGTGHIPIEEN